MSRNQGFTLIELLIVVAIIGLIAAIAIPNLINAIDRGKQKRTMADIRTVATAVEAYSVDHSTYPQYAQGPVDSNVADDLEPIHIKTCPREDGWARSLHYVSDNASDYTLGSGGRDGNAPDLSASAGPTHSFDDDIVFSNGSFRQWPEHLQQ
jgi:type II secretion system protein G